MDERSSSIFSPLRNSNQTNELMVEPVPKKRARLEDEEKDAKPYGDLSTLMGNRKYVKSSELTRELLLSYLESGEQFLGVCEVGPAR